MFARLVWGMLVRLVWDVGYAFQTHIFTYTPDYSGVLQNKEKQAGAKLCQAQSSLS